MNRLQREASRALAKGWLTSPNRGSTNPWAGITNNAPGRKAAYIAHGLPSHYNGNRAILSSLQHEANKQMVRYGRSAKSVGAKLATSTQRLVGTKTTLAPSQAPFKGFGGSGFTGNPATVLGAAPSRGNSILIRPSAPVGVAAPPYVNPPTQGYPAGSAIRGMG